MIISEGQVNQCQRQQPLGHRHPLADTKEMLCLLWNMLFYYNKIVVVALNC